MGNGIFSNQDLSFVSPNFMPDHGSEEIWEINFQGLEQDILSLSLLLIHVPDDLMPKGIRVY